MLLLLWLPVALRLLSPMTVQSRFSLLPASISQSLSAYFQAKETTNETPQTGNSQNGTQPCESLSGDSQTNISQAGADVPSTQSGTNISGTAQNMAAMDKSKPADGQTGTNPSDSMHPPANTDKINPSGDVQNPSDPSYVASSLEASDSKLPGQTALSDATKLPNNGGLSAAREKTLFLKTASTVWFAGVLLLTAYVLFELLRLRRLTKIARVREIDGIPVYFGEHIPAPFLCGFFTPRIYLPDGLAAEYLPSVLAHESMHKNGRDHLLKPLAFLITVIYWFHPLVWLSYILFCKDLELACDERVISTLDTDGRKEYSRTLLAISTMPRTVYGYPVAFGETDVAGRIRHICSFRKPKKAFTVLCVLLCATLTACFSTNPKGSGEPPASGKGTPTPAAEPTDAPTPTATPTVAPTTAPEPGSAFYLDPNDPAALRNPLKNEIELTATVSDSLLLQLSCQGLGTTDTRQLAKSLEKRDVTRYLVRDLGAECKATTYYFTLTAEHETLSRSTENHALMTTYSCVKETADYTVAVCWTYEYVEGYGWALSGCTVTPAAKNGSLPFEDTDPFVFERNLFQSHLFYTGDLEKAPESFRIPATDLDNDGILDHIYRKLTYIEAPYNTYQASITVQFSSGGELLLVEDEDKYAFPSLTVCDLNGDGRSDILFSLYGSGTGGEYSYHYPFTRNPQGEWQVMPKLPVLRLRAMPVSDSEIILTHEGNTVAGPFCVEDIIDYQYQNVANMDEWLEAAFLVEYDETTNEKGYFTYVEPVSVTSSDKKAPENPLKAALACGGCSYDPHDRVFFPFNACWNLWFTQDGWLITDVEVEPIITLRD